jgi:uncharacterized membrane protein (UPF0182 family)
MVGCAPTLQRGGWVATYIDGAKKAGRRRPLLISLGVAVLVAFLSARSVLSAWVELLWFGSLGYAEVFWRSLSVQVAVFVFFAGATFAILFGALTALRRLHADDVPAARALVINGQTVSLPIGPVLRVLTWVVSVGVALITGASMLADWPTLALAWYAQRGGAADPIFGRPLSFYLFTLPAWEAVNSWLLSLAVLVCVAAVLMLLLTSGARALNKGRMTYGVQSSPWRGLSAAVAFLLAVLAMTTYVSRFDALMEHHTVFDGVTYTDAHITLGGLLVVVAALLVGAGLAAVNALKATSARRIITAVAPAVVVYLGLGIVGWYVSNFVVKPNELVREEPYITRNIEATRAAFGLDKFVQREFPAETTPDAADPANNQPTLNNIRLWDWRALQDTLRQVQEIRTYYDFPDIDIDRYNLNGQVSEVMLGTRELNVDKLPESSRNWINEKLIYTHGYGLTMNPVNGFTSEGLPTLLLSNMPVQSTVAGLGVTRPEIYFGELTDTDVYVKTKQQEFDYPQGQNNTLTSYQGSGGILLGGWLRRVLLAAERGDLGKVPFSDDITAQTRLLMRRNIRARVTALAPFLTLDGDPYVVLGDDGRISWVMDAYTTSNTYPYATHYDLAGTPVNYARNSVKIVVDAYNGTTKFYVFDATDPVIMAYRRLFPTLFIDAAAMPADLRRHVRYPEDLLTLQSQVYGLYHMQNPAVFFNREDLWSVATETGADASGGGQVVHTMAPNYVLMKLPTSPETNGAGEEFVEILPFTPANRNNLIGWIAARSDGDAYGTAVVYDFPKTRLIDGPQQIEARIDQNAQLSGQLTLWNQQGSHVLRGSLLVIPTGKALLYAEPIYLQAEQSPMPELRLVVLALQDRLAYGPTFRAALASLFGGETSSLSSTEPQQASGTAAAPGMAMAPQAASAPQSVNALISEASRDFDDYQRLTAAGKLSEAGAKLEALKQVLQRLNGQAK